jgi:hypothetical protein
LNIEFGVKDNNTSAKIGNFALYKVLTNNKSNLNQIMVDWWYTVAAKQNWGTSATPIIIPESSQDYYHILYDNIIFPSAVCAYEDFTLFTTTDNKVKPGYTNHYKSLYFPKDPIYNIIGRYNIKNMYISLIEGLPSDVNQDQLICYQQLSRYA